LREVLKDVKIKNLINNFLGYQTLNESLKWLRIKLRYGKNPTYDGNNTPKIDNPQPSS
jgi:hypothetical protein